MEILNIKYIKRSILCYIAVLFIHFIFSVLLAELTLKHNAELYAIASFNYFDCAVAICMLILIYNIFTNFKQKERKNLLLGILFCMGIIVEIPICQIFMNFQEFYMINKFYMISSICTFISLPLCGSVMIFTKKKICNEQVTVPLMMVRIDGSFQQPLN